MYTIDQIKNMVFIDIETAACEQEIETLFAEKPQMREHWRERELRIRRDQVNPNGVNVDDTSQDLWEKNAGLMAEWGQVVCISIGQIRFDELDQPVDFVANSFYGKGEHKILEQFMTLAQKAMRKNLDLKWCGHNIKGFDFPYMIKRSLINGVRVPEKLHIHRLKPWEMPFVDTKQDWEFGSWGNSARLGHLCDLFGISTPKDDMHGGEVNGAYWDGEEERIKEYCEKDVKAVANLVLKMTGLPTV